MRRSVLLVAVTAAVVVVVAGAVGVFLASGPSGSAQGRIAFVRDPDLSAQGGAEIYVMNADGSSQRRLTRNKAVDYDPVWSPAPPREG